MDKLEMRMKPLNHNLQSVQESVSRSVTKFFRAFTIDTSWFSTLAEGMLPKPIYIQTFSKEEVCKTSQGEMTAFYTKTSRLF